VKIINWILDDEGAGTPFLVKITSDERYMGYRACTFSGLMGLMSDQSYAEFIDETPDTLDVWVLTEQGPVPCKIIRERREDIGMIAVTVSYRDPLVKDSRARDAWIHETGYYRIMGV